MLLEVAILCEELATNIALKSLDIAVNRIYMPLQAILIIVLLIASGLRAAKHLCVSILTLSLILKEWGLISLLLNL